MSYPDDQFWLNPSALDALVPTIDPGTGFVKSQFLPPTSGGGGGSFSVTVNGDGTATLTENPGGEGSIVNNGDGTATITI